VPGLLCALQRSSQAAGAQETAYFAAVKAGGIVAHYAPPIIN
jgi:hypothetical protein